MNKDSNKTPDVRAGESVSGPGPTRGIATWTPSTQRGQAQDRRLLFFWRPRLFFQPPSTPLFIPLDSPFNPLGHEDHANRAREDHDARKRDHNKACSVPAAYI